MDLVKSMRVIGLKCTIPAEEGQEEKVNQACLLELTSHSGLKGYGEVQTGSRVPGVVERMVMAMKPIVINKNPADYRMILKELKFVTYSWSRKGLGFSVLGAMEVALMDLYARQLGVPLYQLLGGVVRDRIRVYASGGLNQVPSHMKKEIEGYLQKGFTAIKVRIGRNPDFQEEIKLLSLIREIIGENFDLLIDAGQQYKEHPWPLPVAMRVAQVIEKFRPFWYEDPYIVNDAKGLANLRQCCNIPIAAGESLASHWEAVQLIDYEAVDVIQPDVAVIGGFTEHKKVAEYAAARGIPVANHTWGTGVSVMANLHAQFATENLLIAEMPCLPNPIREIFFEESLLKEDGCVHLPQKSGLGVEVTQQIEEKYGYRW